MNNNNGVLVVDTDHDTRVEIRKILEAAGYFVVSSANGADAIAILEKISPPRFILVSNSLSLMSAEQFLSVIAAHPELASARILHLRTQGELPLPGVRDVVDKPIRTDDLLKQLRR